MRIGSFIALAALAAFVAWCFRRNEEVRAASRATREDVGRWEAEGGNIPAVATPSPAPTPSPYAGGDPNVRH